MDDEHWITEEVLKQLMAQSGFSESAIKSLKPDLIEALLGGIDHYGNLGADLATAFDLIMRQLTQQLRQT